MVTLTPTKARQKIGSYLARALAGEDIGIVWDGRIVALRPVAVYSEDWAMQEYEVTSEELDRLVQKAGREVEQNRKSGSFHKYRGSLDELIKHRAKR